MTLAQLREAPSDFGHQGPAGACGSPPWLGDCSDACVEPLASPGRASGLPDAAAESALVLRPWPAAEEGGPFDLGILQFRR